MKILVLGGAGYIGVPLIKRLLDEGDIVILKDRFLYGRDSLLCLKDYANLYVEKTDVRDVHHSWFNKVDAVVDLASLTGDPASNLVPEATKDFHLATGNVLQMSKKMGISRYVYASSCSVYGAANLDIVNETSPVNPVSLYARTKLEAEKLVMGQSTDELGVVCLRNSTIYGLAPRMRFDLVVNIMALNAWQYGRVDVHGGGTQWRPFIHVEDTARAFLLATKAPHAVVKDKIFNVGDNEHNYRIIDIANIIKSMRPSTEIIIHRDTEDHRTYNVKFDLIEQELGFKAILGIQDGVSEIWNALDNGLDYNDIRTSNVKYLEHLLQLESFIDKLKYKGRIL